MSEIEKLDVIYKECKRYWGFGFMDRSRKTEKVLARATFMILSYKLTKNSYHNIGLKVKRDHATALHANRKFETYYRDYPRFTEAYKYLIKKISKKLNIKIIDTQEKDKIIDLLKVSLNQLEEENTKLKQKIPKELSSIYLELPEEGVKELIETRVQPFIKMYKTRKNYERKPA